MCARSTRRQAVGCLLALCCGAVRVGCGWGSVAAAQPAVSGPATPAQHSADGQRAHPPETPASALGSGRALGSYEALREACDGAPGTARRELFHVSVARGDWHFGAYDEARAALPVDARPSLRVLRGVAAFLPSGLERLEFPVDASQAGALRERAPEATLRVGFFLGFDGAGERACLLRSAASQSLVRGDLAYIEVLDAEGALVVRADYDRLRAWADDPGQVSIAGSGPRAAIGDPALQGQGVRADAEWVALARAHVSQLVERCYLPALARGASHRASVLVRLTLSSATGAVRAADVELSTLNDTEGARCVADALRDDLRVPPLRAGAASVAVRVPVTLISE